jgi:hypothetical protein
MGGFSGVIVCAGASETASMLNRSGNRMLHVVLFFIYISVWLLSSPSQCSMVQYFSRSYGAARSFDMGYIPTIHFTWISRRIAHASVLRVIPHGVSIPPGLISAHD